MAGRFYRAGGRRLAVEHCCLLLPPLLCIKGRRLQRGVRRTVSPQGRGPLNQLYRLQELTDSALPVLRQSRDSALAIHILLNIARAQATRWQLERSKRTQLAFE
jgi:hypothetical protein